jgi:hypothetical protein
MSSDMDFTQAVEDLDRRTSAEARKRFSEGRKAEAWPSFRLSLGEFRRVYKAEKASREGVPGLFKAVNAGMFEFLTFAKLWELEKGTANGR